MRARLVLAVVLVVAAVLLWWRAPGRAMAPVSRGAGNASARPGSNPAAPASPRASFSRDPFRFAEVGPANAARPAPTLAPATPSPDPPPPVRVRLMGLMRRAGVLRAALVVDGQVVLASAGETVDGFRVVSLDEEGGVRLRDPAGLEATLALPEEP
jgi:hypothetical protein